MSSPDVSQQNLNGSLRDEVMAAPVAEALWRLRLTPSAAELAHLLPGDVYVSPLLLSLDALLEAEEETFELGDVHLALMLPTGPAEVLGPVPST